MATITVRLQDSEKKVFQEYADFYGITLSEFIKQTASQKIEDTFDEERALKAYAEYKEDGIEYSIEEMRKMNGL